jgi:hypothetical protein
VDEIDIKLRIRALTRPTMIERDAIEKIHLQARLLDLRLRQRVTPQRVERVRGLLAFALDVRDGRDVWTVDRRGWRWRRVSPAAAPPRRSYPPRLKDVIDLLEGLLAAVAARERERVEARALAKRNRRQGTLW